MLRTVTIGAVAAFVGALFALAFDAFFASAFALVIVLGGLHGLQLFRYVAQLGQCPEGSGQRHRALVAAFI
jgi:hypothetical protein